MKKILFLSWCAVTALVLINVGGCSKEEVQLRVQLLNASYHSAYPDFYVQDTKRASYIGMGIGSNSHTADLTANELLMIAVKDPVANATVASGNYNGWKAGWHYSYVLYSDYANPKTTLLSDSIAWPNTGRFKVRFAHFSADAPALDVFYNNDTVAFNKVYFGTDSTNAIGEFVDLPAGTYTVTVKDHATGQTLVTQPNISIADNRILENFATGLMSEPQGSFFQLGGVAR
jgi:hypothetical protein